MMIILTVTPVGQSALPTQVIEVQDTLGPSAAAPAIVDVLKRALVRLSPTLTVTAKRQNTGETYGLEGGQQLLERVVFDVVTEAGSVHIEPFEAWSLHLQREAVKEAIRSLKTERRVEVILA